jgi:hypothetical protein
MKSALSPGFRAAAASLLAIGLAASAARADAAGQPTPRFGTKDRILTHILFSDFVPSDSGIPYVAEETGGRVGIHTTAPTVDAFFLAGVHVPSGVLLTYFELDYCDTSGAQDVVLDLVECSYDGEGCQALSSLHSSDGSNGCALVSADLTPLAYRTDNNTRELWLSAETGSATNATQLNGAYIGYRLEISAAPGLPTFGDVPASHLYFRAIEALAASGVTGGCGNGNFCPSQNVTRGEMAAFLARALGLHFPN